MNDVPEFELIKRAKGGEEDAFMELVTRASKKCRPMLQKQFNLQNTDLDDVSQIALCKAWNRLSTYRIESSFITWFFIIFRNEALNFVKKRNVLQANELPAHFLPQDGDDNDYEHVLNSSIDQQLHDTAASIIEKREMLQEYEAMLSKVLNKLSPEHSQIITLALKEGKSYEEISKTLDIPIGTVMSRLFYARTTAQKLIKKYAEQHNIQLAFVG